MDEHISEAFISVEFSDLLMVDSFVMIKSGCLKLGMNDSEKFKCTGLASIKKMWHDMRGEKRYPLLS